MTSSEAQVDSATATKDEQTPTIDSFDETEEKLGISDYMSLGDGFSAVVKARYSDFLVHEVDMDGKVARLTNRDIPVDKTQEPEGEDQQQDNNERATNEPKTWKQLQSELEGMIKDAAIAGSVFTMLTSHNNRAEYEDKFVTLPALEKEERSAIHNWIRNSIHCARADTLDGKIRIWHVRFEKEMPNYKTFGSQKKRFKPSWPKDRPDFLQFVLYKENLDTTTATKELSRKGGKARIGYAGMKDKRGITTQFCTLFHTEPQRIMSQRLAGGGGNTKQKGYSVVQVGNFEYVSKEKERRLGSLQGNRFDVVMRNVKTGSTDGVDRKVVQDAAKAMKEKGFINFFGTQRFGKYKDTHLVGVAVLQGDFEKACDIVMEPKPNDRPDADRARKEWQDRFKEGKSAENEAACAKRIAKSLNRFMTAENSITQSLARKPLDYKRAFGCIPKNLRMMFLHAVQSLVWNRAASYRIKSMNKDAVVEGDLVQTAEDSKVEVLVTEDDIKNKRYTLEDVVVPLIGTKSKLPKNEMADVMKQMMEDIGVSVDMFKKVQDKDLAISGDIRKLMVRPSDFEYEINEYYDPLQPLLQTDLMKLNGDDIVISPQNEGENLKVALIVGFTLPSSSYATIALRELMKKPTSTDYQKDLKLT